MSGTLRVVADGEISTCDLEAVSGSIGLSGWLGSGANVEIESHSGNVTLTLPADTSASRSFTNPS